MGSHLYGGYGGSDLPSLYTSRLTGSSSIADAYSDSSLLASSRYLSSDPLRSSDSRYSVLDKGSLYADGLRYSGSEIAGIGSYSARSITPSLYSQSSWNPLDSHSVLPPPGVEASAVGLKRQSQALYHQNLLGTHNSIAQSEALFSTNPLTKRPRIESASSLPIYPQRPGEKDCAHYMLTRTCKFGDKCKFDHPLWVPEGGIPDWKEIPFIPHESLPERPGEPDCPYFLKTQKCKYGLRCKFNHPKDKLENSVFSNVETADQTSLPERPSEPACAYYMKTGNCKFGANCKFDHPKDHVVPEAEPNLENTETSAPIEKPFIPVAPALLHNSKGLPVRPGEVDCPFYLKTGSCKYGATCRFNHPDRNATNPPSATLTQAVINSPALALLNPVAGAMPHANLDPWLAQSAVNLTATVYPQRPGQLECDYYMKTGECKFGERCKFHHPMDRTVASVASVKAVQASVKLTLAGLPRREGEAACAFYMKTGTCKFGATCRFDHPPPGEAVAKAVAIIGGSEEKASDSEEDDAE